MNVQEHLEELDREGYTLIREFLPAFALRRVRDGLARHLETHTGRNAFEGYRTERVYTLVGRGSVFEEIAEDMRVLAILDRLLQPGYLLTASQAICIPAGTCILFHGTSMHRGGANRSAAPRLALSSQYCEPWARTQENFFLGVPRERAARMSPRLQVLLGYEVMPPFMGHVTASHPRKVLQPGYVNALIADEARTRTRSP